MEKQHPSQQGGYQGDLAFIHDAGFTHLATSAAQTLLRMLPPAPDLVIDLGCGSGTFLKAMAAAGHNVLGIDLSPAMIELARKAVPSGAFRCQSLLDAELPSCVAVTAIGEVFNYLFDESHSIERLHALLRRIHHALIPGGVLLFDVAQRGRAGQSGVSRNWSVADDWVCLYEAREMPDQDLLIREITTFRREGELYRRSDECHRLRLLSIDDLSAILTSLDFEVKQLAAYSDFVFPPGWRGIAAKKRGPHSV